MVVCMKFFIREGREEKLFFVIFASFADNKV